MMEGETARRRKVLNFGSAKSSDKISAEKSGREEGSEQLKDACANAKTQHVTSFGGFSKGTNEKGQEK